MSPGEVLSEEPPRHFPGQGTTGQRGKMEMISSSAVIGPDMKNKEKGVIQPREGLMRKRITLMGMETCSQCWKHPEST